MFAALFVSPWLAFVITLLLGLMIGSFLNVVIHRLPQMLERRWRAECQEFLAQPVDKTEPYNLLRPPSQCPHCRAPVRWWNNIPLLSYLLLRGRCRQCSQAIHWRYPLVELLSATLALWCWQHYGWGPTMWAACFLGWLLLCQSAIDWRCSLLPDELNMPGLWLGLLLSAWGFFALDPYAAIIGAVAGYMSLWTVFQLFYLVTKKQGMGAGDFKLFALLGAWLGWQMLPIILLLASLMGSVIGLALLASGRWGRNKPLPFGPYLAMAGWLAMLYGDELNRYWLGS